MNLCFLKGVLSHSFPPSRQHCPTSPFPSWVLKPSSLESPPPANCLLFPTVSTRHLDPIKGTQEHPYFSPLPFLTPSHHLHAPSYLTAELHHHCFVPPIADLPPALPRPPKISVRTGGISFSFCCIHGELLCRIALPSELRSSPVLESTMNWRCTQSTGYEPSSPNFSLRSHLVSD
jgi:hypothetical protein